MANNLWQSNKNRGRTNKSLGTSFLWVGLLGLCLLTSNWHLTRAAAGDIVRVSVSSSTVEGQGMNTYPSISGNGRCITFVSDASNLVSSDSNDTTAILPNVRLYFDPYLGHCGLNTKPVPYLGRQPKQIR